MENSHCTALRLSAEERFVQWYRVERGSSKVLIIGFVDFSLWQDSLLQRKVLFSHSHPFIMEQRQSGHSAIMVWEDQWRLHSQIIQSRINALLGSSDRIPGRLTKVRRIDKASARAFLENNHLQGATSSKYQFGLYLPESYFRVLPERTKMSCLGLKELLVATATFSHVRVFDKEGKPHRSYELIRFANLLGHTVVGGLDKCLKAFITEVHPDDIMTYADLDWSDGRSYLRLGFVPISELEPMNFEVFPETGKRRLVQQGEEHISDREYVWNAGSMKLVKTFSI